MHHFPYHVLVFEWTCGVEAAVVRHGMKISTLVAMDADWEIIIIIIIYLLFFPLTKKTGLQVQPTTDMQFFFLTESREEEKVSHVTPGAPPLCYGLTSARRKHSRRSEGTEKLVNGWLRWVDIYVYIQLHVRRAGYYSGRIIEIIKFIIRSWNISDIYYSSLLSCFFSFLLSPSSLCALVLHHLSDVYQLIKAWKWPKLEIRKLFFIIST